MALTDDILAAWRRPRAFIRRKLGDGVREDRALAVLMGAGALIFVAQWPVLARAAELDPAVPFEARIGGALLASVFLLPLAMYLLAALSHVIARAVGGRGGWFGARLALFWALFATSPLMLLNGLVGGVLGQGRAEMTVGLLVLGGFLYLWMSMLTEAEREP